MDYVIKYSRAAKLDIDRIYSEVFQACRDKDTTKKYLIELLDKIEEKTLFPDSGTPICFENMFTGYRYVSYKAYSAFYRIEETSVLIDRILYNKSDYMRLLKFDN